MLCLHPACPKRLGASISWVDVVDRVAVAKGTRLKLVAFLNANCGLLSNPPAPAAPPSGLGAGLQHVLRVAPCLYNQLSLRPTAAAIVHFCELNMGAAAINAVTAARAFRIQHPTNPHRFAAYRPALIQGDAGSIMEELCSEVLSNEGLPRAALGRSGWPVWTVPGHVVLNEGRMRTAKALGDIVIPAAPSNLVISVKTQAARERLLYSGNSIEAIGFGFFDDPSEFWTESRMTLFRRMGFTAIYLPLRTHRAIQLHLEAKKTGHRAVNVNGTPLYRSMYDFGRDMRRIVGRVTLDL